jgi:hypothetical protein
MKATTPFRLPMIVVFGVVTVMAVVYVAYEQSSRRSSSFSTPAAGGLASLPVANFNLREGAGQGLVQAYCTTCHSLAPIVRHDGFEPQTWADEVQKMRQQYGCPLDDTTASTITKYLQDQYAASPASGGPAPGFRGGED